MPTCCYAHTNVGQPRPTVHIHNTQRGTYLSHFEGHDLVVPSTLGDVAVVTAQNACLSRGYLCIQRGKPRVLEGCEEGLESVGTHAVLCDALSAK